jgi:hypothetical protein
MAVDCMDGLPGRCVDARKPGKHLVEASMTTPEPPPEDPATRRRARLPALVVEDFKSVRRWLVVLGVIAVAAIGVALYAVLESDEAAEEGQLEATERTLEQRVSDLEKRAEEESDVERLEQRARGAATEEDLARLDRRLRRVERDVVDAVDAAADTGQGLNRLEDRVEGLERRRR